MLTYLVDDSSPLRLLGYNGFRCILAIIISFTIGMIVAPIFIYKLKKLKLEQVFRTKAQVNTLADLHASKAGTPMMGGLIVFTATLISSLICAKPNLLVFISLGIYTLYTLLGFADDYSKFKGKNTKGVSGKLKLLIQFIVCSLSVLCLYFFTDYFSIYENIYLPFLKYPIISSIGLIGVIAFFFLVVAGSSNSINLTDGLDGLAIGCTISASLAFALIAYCVGSENIANYLLLTPIADAMELSIICCSLVGAGMAFLWHNAYPAKIFMGDTGSLGIGGLIGSVAFLTLNPFTLVIVGGIFVIECLSVIIQCTSFKLTKKRVFLCAPIHHHFEKLGWPENQVVVRFWIISLGFALLGLASLKLR